MIYFICWAVFIVTVIMATVLTAVIGGRSRDNGQPAAEAGAAGAEESFGEDEMGEPEMDADDFAGERVEEFAEAAGDDFAEFEKEFK